MGYIKTYWKSFISNPKAVFWFYILVNLVPSTCLIFTEPFNFMGKFLLILFPLGLYFILFTLSRNTGLIQLLLIPLLVLHAFQLVLLYLYGEDVIAVDMFLNVVTTNVSEACELLGGILLSIVIVCVLYIPTMIIAGKECKRKLYMPPKFRRVIFFTGISVMLLSYGLMFWAENKNSKTFSYYHDVYPVNILYNLDFAIKKMSKVNRYNETSKDFTFEALRTDSASQREVYVLVIGETGRAENWSLYGYDRVTTPHMQNDTNIVYFKDAITQSNTTHKSVSIILSAASAENYNIIYDQKSIITAFKECGFKTIFISNQSPNRTFTDFFSQEADLSYNFRTTDSKVNKLDMDLLPDFEHCLDSIQDNLLVIFHSYGSHFNYSERYPDEFSKFTPDKVTGIRAKDRDILINAYDNTILYTDHFLNSITTILKERNICSTMFYVSDHGEDLLDDDRLRFLHASPHPTFYQLKIPMLIWFSDTYKQSFPEKYSWSVHNKEMPVTTNAVFHTLLDMASIDIPFLDEDLSLVNRLFEKRKRLYLGDHDDPVFFYDANLKPQDKEMIEKRKIYH